MKYVVLFIVAFVLGAIFSHHCIYSTEQYNLKTWREDSKEGILIYIGHDENMKHINSGTANYNSDPSKSKNWNEVLVKKYKSKEEAIKARDAVLKQLGEK